MSYECDATDGLSIVCSLTPPSPTVNGSSTSRSGPGAAAQSEVFAYTVVVTIDGHEVERIDSGLEVFAAGTELPHNPFVHGDTKTTQTAPGAPASVKPVFRQEKAFQPSAEAVVVSFSDPSSRSGLEYEGAEAVAGYDNCVDTRHGADEGVTCVITEFEESEGSLFTLSDPVSYAIDADMVGPLDACLCYYNAYTINAVTLASEFGDLSWDPGSANRSAWSPPRPGTAPPTKATGPTWATSPSRPPRTPTTSRSRTWRSPARSAARTPSPPRSPTTAPPRRRCAATTSAPTPSASNCPRAPRSPRSTATPPPPGPASARTTSNALTKTPPATRRSAASTWSATSTASPPPTRSTSPSR